MLLTINLLRIRKLSPKSVLLIEQSVLKVHHYHCVNDRTIHELWSVKGTSKQEILNWLSYVAS